jgi:hypothetical protein
MNSVAILATAELPDAEGVKFDEVQLGRFVHEDQ